MLLAIELADEKVRIAVGLGVLLGNAFVGRVAVESFVLEVLPIGLCRRLWSARCETNAMSIVFMTVLMKPTMKLCLVSSPFDESDRFFVQPRKIMKV